MAELSPFLNANPIDRAYALGGMRDNYKVASGTLVEIYLTKNGRMEWSSGAMRFSYLTVLDVPLSPYRRRKDRFRLGIQITQYVYGYPYLATFPIPFQFPPANKQGKMLLRVTGRAVQSSPGYAKATQWASAKRKASWGARPASNPRSTTLRPSPEDLKRPFLRTFESNGSGSYVISQTISPRTVFFREWTGSRTPGWGKKGKTNYVDNNHTVRIVDVQENKHYWYQTQPASGVFELRIFPFVEVFAIPASPETHLSLAEFNALKKLIAGAQVGIQANLAQNIAQVSQLSSLIVGTATSMVNSLRQLKRLNFAGAINALGSARASLGKANSQWTGGSGKLSKSKSVASNWLALQYGWKPLLSDIEGMLKIMGNQMVADDFVQRVSSSASARKQFSANLPVVGSGFPNGVTLFDIKTRCKFQIRYRMDNPLLAVFAQTGFTNPVNLFWEILPFSFVADWFLPIGSYLEALTAWDGATFLGGSKTLFTRERMDSTVSYGGQHPAEATVNVQHNSSYRREDVRLQRVALTSFPSPVIPRFSNGINEGNRAANAIALLMGAFRK